MMETKYNGSLGKRKPSSGIVSPNASSMHYCGTFAGCKYPSRYKNPYDKKSNGIIYIDHDESVPELNG